MYRHAHWWVLVISAARISGFIPTYGMYFEVVQIRHHVRVAGAMARILLLFVQPLLISRGLRRWRRALGRLGKVSSLAFRCSGAAGGRHLRVELLCGRCGLVV